METGHRRVAFRGDGIQFEQYPYPPASVYPDGVVAPAAIRDADPRAAPPELRLATGERLFIPAHEREEFAAWLGLHEVPVLSRLDVWDLLLEPFLDTAPVDEWRTLHRLQEVGLNREVVGGLRSRFAPVMQAYDAGSRPWNWCHLGLADLLDAHLGRRVPEEFRLPAEEFEAFYWETMAIAELGTPHVPPVE